MSGVVLLWCRLMVVSDQRPRFSGLEATLDVCLSSNGGEIGRTEQRNRPKPPFGRSSYAVGWALSQVFDLFTEADSQSTSRVKYCEQNRDVNERCRRD